MGGNLREIDHLEEPGVDGRIILRRVFRNWDGGRDWIDLAQDRGRCRALVNAVINFQIPLNAGNFLISCGPVVFPRRTLLREVSK